MIRWIAVAGLVVLAVLATLLTFIHSGWWFAAAPLIFVALVGVYDMVQRSHSVTRNYPVLGHFRFLFEEIRPEIRQYFIESNTEGKPYDRETRDLVYDRAKGNHGEEPFGTQRDVNATGYEFVAHSLRAKPKPDGVLPSVRLGGPKCTQPYDIALLNVSAMSFGSLSANAIEALNGGAAKGGFAHDTGEGSISKYHTKHGGDLIWEIASAYFGCRTPTATSTRTSSPSGPSSTRSRPSPSRSPRARNRDSAVFCREPRSTRRSQGHVVSRSARPSCRRQRTTRSTHRSGSSTSSTGSATSAAASRWASSCASGRAVSSSRSARR